MSVLQVRNNADTDFDSLGFLDPHTSTNKNYPQHRTNDYSDTDTTCTDTSSETGSSPLEEDDDDDDGADQHDNDDNCDQEKREHETDKLVKKHENDTEFYCDIDMLDDQVCTVVSTLSSTLSSIPALSTALLGKTSQTKSNGTMVPPTIVTFQSLFATTTTTTTTTVSRATILNASLGSFTPFQVLNLSNQKLNAHYLSTRSLSIFRQVLVKNLLALLYEVNPTLDDQWWDSTSGYAAVSGQGYGSVDGHDNNSNTMVDPTSSGDMNNPFVSDKTLRSYNGFDGFDDDDDEDEDDYYYRKRSRDPGAGSLRPWSSSEDKTTQDDVNQLVLQAAAALTRASSSKKQNNSGVGAGSGSGSGFEAGQRSVNPPPRLSSIRSPSSTSLSSPSSYSPPTSSPPTSSPQSSSPSSSSGSSDSPPLVTHLLPRIKNNHSNNNGASSSRPKSAELPQSLQSYLSNVFDVDWSVALPSSEDSLFTMGAGGPGLGLGLGIGAGAAAGMGADLALNRTLSVQGPLPVSPPMIVPSPGVSPNAHQHHQQQQQQRRQSIVALSALGPKPPEKDLPLRTTKGSMTTTATSIRKTWSNSSLTSSFRSASSSSLSKGWTKIEHKEANKVGVDGLIKGKSTSSSPQKVVHTPTPKMSPARPPLPAPAAAPSSAPTPAAHLKAPVLQKSKSLQPIPASVTRKTTLAPGRRSSLMHASSGNTNNNNNNNNSNGLDNNGSRTSDAMPTAAFVPTMSRAASNSNLHSGSSAAKNGVATSARASVSVTPRSVVVVPASALCSTIQPGGWNSSLQSAGNRARPLSPPPAAMGFISGSGSASVSRSLSPAPSSASRPSSPTPASTLTSNFKSQPLSPSPPPSPSYSSSSSPSTSLYAKRTSSLRVSGRPALSQEQQSRHPNSAPLATEGLHSAQVARTATAMDATSTSPVCSQHPSPLLPPVFVDSYLNPLTSSPATLRKVNSGGSGYDHHHSLPAAGASSVSSKPKAAAMTVTKSVRHRQVSSELTETPNSHISGGRAAATSRATSPSPPRSPSTPPSPPPPSVQTKSSKPPFNSSTHMGSSTGAGSGASVPVARMYHRQNSQPSFSTSPSSSYPSAPLPPLPQINLATKPLPTTLGLSSVSDSNVFSAGDPVLPPLFPVPSSLPTRLPQTKQQERQQQQRQQQQRQQQTAQRMMKNGKTRPSEKMRFIQGQSEYYTPHSSPSLEELVQRPLPCIPPVSDGSSPLYPPVQQRQSSLTRMLQATPSSAPILPSLFSSSCPLPPVPPPPSPPPPPPPSHDHVDHDQDPQDYPYQHYASKSPFMKHGQDKKKHDPLPPLPPIPGSSPPPPSSSRWFREEHGLAVEAGQVVCHSQSASDPGIPRWTASPTHGGSGEGGGNNRWSSVKSMLGLRVRQGAGAGK